MLRQRSIVDGLTRSSSAASLVVSRSCGEGAGGVGFGASGDKLSADEAIRLAVSLALTDRWGALRGAFAGRFIGDFRRTGMCFIHYLI